jgi:hypothetical protein
VNNIYCIEDQGNSEVFQKKLVSTQQILETVKEFSSLFENKTLLSFARWCSTNMASFLKAKADKNSSNRRRELYVMKDVYHGNITLLLSLNVG